MLSWWILHMSCKVQGEEKRKYFGIRFYGYSFFSHVSRDAQCKWNIRVTILRLGGNAFTQFNLRIRSTLVRDARSAIATSNMCHFIIIISGEWKAMHCCSQGLIFQGRLNSWSCQVCMEWICAGVWAVWCHLQVSDQHYWCPCDHGPHWPTNIVPGPDSNGTATRIQSTRAWFTQR